MASQFSSEILKLCVGQMCQSIGYQGVYSTPLEVLSDLLHRYLSELCRLTHRYTEHFGRSEPTLDDLGLAFMDMGISVSELEDYFNNVDCPPFPHPLPALPVPRPSNLNFLKPGSREILSRPIHIHEHLPPMYPEKEEEEVDVKVTLDDGVGDGTSSSISPQPALKRPADSEGSPSKKLKFSMEDEGQPVREIVSVMMTTSGFISSAREGKLPEACCPDIPMATPRCTSPSTVGKKKLTVEKLIRQKNSQVGLGGGRGGPSRPPRPNKIKANKDRVIGKSLKMPKMPKIPKLPSKSPSLPKGGPPGSSPLPPKLKMPLMKPPTPKPPKISSPKPSAPPKSSTPKVSPAKSSQSPRPQPPKSSTPKIKVPKPPRTPKTEGKTKTKPRDGDKEGEGPSSGNKKVKKEKEGSKKEGKKEGKKEKDGNKRSKEARRDKEGRKEGNKETKKEKEIKKERDRERERELIIALASSSAVTVTSIPAPSKAPDAPPPPAPEKAEAKSKLSIFKKIKTKDAREERDGPNSGQGPTTAHPSRDSSPDLMIDETPGRGHRRPPEEPPPEIPPPPVPEDLVTRSPADYTSYHDDLSPPTTPSTPRTPEVPAHLVPHRPVEKRRGKDKGREKRPRKDRSKSPKGGGPFSPRDTMEPDPPERPKTPEGGLPMEDMGMPPGPPFIPTFPTAPGFIPPFSRFPFMPPFGGPPPRPGMAPPIPDLRLPPHHHPFLPRPPLKRPMEDDRLCSVEDTEHLERPPTPRHPREGSPLMMRGHGSPMRSPSPSTPPRPRTPAHHSPAHHSPPPQPLPRPHPRPDKPEKTEKEKKKEHKKEKKEKEKEKEKVKKKKDKKDKEKEKDKSDKRKEKEKLKQEKKEKKVKREKEEGGGPKITMKLPTSDLPIPTTPKLVIKPVVKHDEPPPPPPPPPTTQDDQPGSPEIAKISALITRPPRSQQKRAESPPALPVLKIKDVTNPMTKHKEVKESGHTPAKVKEVPPLKIKNPTTSSNKGSSKVASATPKQSMAKLPTSPKATTPKTTPPTPKILDEKKIPGIKKPKEKKEKKEKKKDIPTPSPNPLVGSISKPGVTTGVTGESSYPAHSPMPPHSSPPPMDTPKPSKKQEQKGTGLLTETVGPIGHFVDDQGNEVWICPTCGKQDDGSPMIGCDTCDDWYHWVCVGIQVPPNDDVNWYCPRCLSQHKQRGAPPEKKKRGRKKK